MIIFTPEQLARLLSRSEKINSAQQSVENKLSTYVKSLGKASPKPEQFDRFQNLFSRFLSDQRREREPVAIPLHEEVEEVDDQPLGGISFRRGEGEVGSILNTPSDRRSSITSFRKFVAGKRKSGTLTSTPKKRRTTEVTPDKNLVDGERKLRWRVEKVK